MRSPAGWLLLLPLPLLPLLLPEADRNGTAQDADAPRLRCVLSGGLLGRLEPCGCASGQMGGLARRAFRLQQGRDEHDLRIEGGNFVAGGSPLDLAKLDTSLIALDMARYDAICLGPNELGLPPDVLRKALQVFSGAVVASDVVPRSGEPIGARHFEKQAGKVKVRVVSLALRLPPGAEAAWKLEPPAEAWKAALAGASPDTLRIVYVHGDEQGVRDAQALAPSPDLVVAVTAAVGEPAPHADITGKAPLVFTGIRGRMLLELWLVRERGQSRVTRYEVLQLDDSPTAPGTRDDPATRELILGHRQLVKEDGLLEKMADLVDPPLKARYVGSEACKGCHGAAWDAWSKSKHAIAWTTLEKAERGELKSVGGKSRYGWPVTAYPDCVGCHAVGYGHKSGFVNAARTPLLRAVGCEQCHGPGSEHAINPVGKGLILRGDQRACAQCHDFEQSPGFDYAARWKQIEHGK